MDLSYRILSVSKGKTVQERQTMLNSYAHMGYWLVSSHTMRTTIEYTFARHLLAHEN